MDLGLTGARALIGGGSGGLGGAIATVLRAEGADVGLIGRSGERLDAAAARLNALAVPADLSTPDGPAGAVAAAVEAFGGLDLLLVNSGGPPLGRFEDLDEAAWQAALDGTLWSAVRLLRAALPHLREGRGPAILVVLSSSVREPIPGLTTSNLIRPGLAGLIKSLVEEIAPIRINGLPGGSRRTGSPSSTRRGRARPDVPVEEIQRRTIERIPLGRYGDPLELGRVGAFLLSPAASYVTGAIVPVDGGMIRSCPSSSEGHIDVDVSTCMRRELDIGRHRAGRRGMLRPCPIGRDAIAVCHLPDPHACDVGGRFTKVVARRHRRNDRVHQRARW